MVAVEDWNCSECGIKIDWRGSYWRVKEQYGTKRFHDNCFSGIPKTVHFEGSITTDTQERST